MVVDRLPPDGGEDVQGEDQKVLQKHVDGPPFVNRRGEVVVEKVPGRVDQVREDVEAWRRGDFGIPPCPVSLPVCLGLRDVEHLVEVRCWDEPVDEAAPGHLKTGDGAQHDHSCEFGADEIRHGWEGGYC